MEQQLISLWKQYGFAVFITIVTLVVRVVMGHYIGNQFPFMLFSVTVMIAGWYGGLRSALTASTLCAVIGTYYFLSPHHSFYIESANDRARLSIFIFNSALISLFSGNLHKTNCLLKKEKALEILRSKQAQQSERLFRSVFNQQFQFMAILERDGLVKEINELPLRAVNAKREDLVGYYFSDAPFWRDLPKMRESWPKRLAYAATIDEPVISEDEYQVADGSVRMAACSVKAVKNEKGEVEFFIVQATDITERLKTELALRESEERWRLAIIGMNDGIWDHGLDHNRYYYSPRYKEMLGYADHELEDSYETWQQLVHPEDHDYVVEQVNKYLNKEAPEYKVMFRMMHKNGSWRWILARGMAFWNENGVAVRFTGANADMTELQTAIETAEAASRAKSQFLANMSHEIRTPMNAVIGITGLLQRDKLSPEKRSELLHTLSISAQSMMDLINDLLDVSKIENDHMELENIPFNLAEMIEEIISIISVRAREKFIDLVIEYDPQLNSSFIGDPLRLRQVIMNLISNAVKFTERGVVTVHVESRSNTQTGAIDILIDIADTGIGIAPEKLDLVFGKFSQADSSMTRKYGGTGLGLSISKSLIELMGGTISVISTVGEGSRFSIQVPLKPAANVIPKEENKTPSSSENNGTKQKILLVEDYKGNVIVATAILESFGYAWDVAENGREAVNKVKETTYDLILMDVQMPFMDGLQATRLIRLIEEEKNRKPVPIIAMTAYSMTGDRERCLEAGMNDYVSKPFKPDVLQEKIRNLLKSKTLKA